MRRVLPLLLAAIWISSLSFGQISISTGIKGGISSSTFGGDVTGTQSPLRSNAAGLFFEIDLPGPINLQPEVLLCSKGTTENALTTTTKTSLTYIEIPFLIRYTLSIPVIEPALFAGPSVGMLLSAKRRSDSLGVVSQETDIKSLLSSTDYGIVVGASVSLPLYITDLSIEARYHYGLTTIAKDVTTKTYNRALFFFVGITL